MCRCEEHWKSVCWKTASPITASAVKKTLSEAGIRLPNSASMPSANANANAMLVAIGMPVPACVGVPALKLK